VLVVVGLILAQDPPQMAVIPDQGAVQEFVTHTALYDELAARAGIRLDGGREDIRGAVPARGAAATARNRPVHGGAGDQPARCAAGRPVEWRHTVIRGDRFSLPAEFSVHTGYRVTPDSRFPVVAALAAS
jgi:GntR family transcriptional regulator